MKNQKGSSPLKNVQRALGSFSGGAAKKRSQDSEGDSSSEMDSKKDAPPVAPSIMTALGRISLADLRRNVQEQNERADFSSTLGKEVKDTNNQESESSFGSGAEDDWRPAPISTFGKRMESSEASQNYNTVRSVEQTELTNAPTFEQDYLSSNTKQEEKVPNGNTGGESQKKIEQKTEMSPYQKIANCLSEELNNLVCKQAQEKAEGDSQSDGQDGSFGELSELDKEDIDLMIQTDFPTYFDAVEDQMKKRRQINEQRERQLELLKAKYSTCRLLMTCDCRRLFFGSAILQQEIEINRQINLHGSKRFNQLGGSSIQQLRDGLKNFKSFDKEIGNDQKLGVLRQKSQLSLGESLSNLKGGKQLFADDQDKKEKIATPSDTAREPEPAAVGEENFSNSEEDQELPHDEEEEDEEFDEENMALLEEDAKNNLCDRINQKVIQYAMIEPSNRRLMIFHMFLSLSFHMDMVFTGFCISSYEFRHGQSENYMNEKQVYMCIFVMQIMEIILRLFTILEIDIYRYELPLEVFSRYFFSLDFITDAITVIPYNRIMPKLIFLRLVRWRKYSDYTEKFRKMMQSIFHGLMEPERVRVQVEQFSYGFWLFLFAHILACFWMQIGYELFYNEDVGWIREMLDAQKLKSTDPVELYITSIYFVMTSFSSVGYGDVTGNQNIEYLYQCLVEMLGIGIFGYMTGMIQEVMTQITEADPSTQYQDNIMNWLVALDKQRSNPIEKEVFQDVRDFYDNAYKYDTQSFQDTGIFEQLKPRLQKELMQKIYAFKSIKFADVFEDCQEAFKFEVFKKFEFQFYPLEHQRQENSNVFDKELVEIPQIERAGDYTRSMYFIINSAVHIMDKEGMYDYGVIGKGGYFGDISILLEKPNAFSYMYDPDESREPLMLYKIDKVDILSIFSKYPLEKKIFMERAKKRMEFFDNYKSETLLSFMKGIVKNPSIVRQNQKHKNKHYKLMQRLRFMKERNVKLMLLKLFLRHYELQRSLKKSIVQRDRRHQHHRSSKAGNEPNIRTIMAKTMSLYNDSINFGAMNKTLSPVPAFKNNKERDPHEDLGYFGTMAQNQTMARRKTAFVGNQTIVSQSVTINANDITPASNEVLIPGFNGTQNVNELQRPVRKNEVQSLQNTHQSLPSNIFNDRRQSELVAQSQNDKNHFRLSFTDTYNEGGDVAQSTQRPETIGGSSPKAQPENTPYFQNGIPNSTISPNKLGLPARSEQITEQLDEKSSLCSSQIKTENQSPGLVNFTDPQKDEESRRRLSEELNECGADFCNYKNIGTTDLESLMVQNMHDIRIVLTEYFRLRDFRKRSIERQRTSVGGIMKAAIKKKRQLLSAKHLDHMDRIIEEYINIEFIQRQILFGRKNLEWLLEEEFKDKPNIGVPEIGVNQKITIIEHKIDTPQRKPSLEGAINHSITQGDKGKQNYTRNFTPGAKNLQKLNFKQETLGSELIDALKAEQFQNDQFRDNSQDYVRPFVEKVKQKCDRLMGKLDDFENWSKRLDDETNKYEKANQTRKSGIVCPKPVIPSDKKKKRNSARLARIKSNERLTLEKNMGEASSLERVQSKDSPQVTGSDKESQQVSLPPPVPPILIPQSQQSDQKKYKQTPLMRFFEKLSVDQQTAIINKARPQIEKYEQSKYKNRFV